MTKPSNVVPLKRKPKPPREPWRDNWEQAYTVKEFRQVLAGAPDDARLYLRQAHLGIVGVVEADTTSYTGRYRGCYGQPTVLLYINEAEVPAPPKPSRSELQRQINRLLEQLADSGGPV
jgi:hypothetical protein